MGHPSMCPNCRQLAPIVYRGVVPTCTACGAARMPLSSPSINLAGQPSRIGGRFAHAVGWLVLVVGLALALGLGLLAGALGGVTIGLALGLPVGIIALALGLFLVIGGRSLHRSGDDEAKTTRLQAVFALAAHRGGVLSAVDVAHVLNMPIVVSDALLTELAKKEPDRVAVEVDEQGALYYRFAPPGQPRVGSFESFDARLRVQPVPPQAVRVPSGAEPEAEGGAEPPLPRAGERAPVRR